MSTEASASAIKSSQAAGAASSGAREAEAPEMAAGEAKSLMDGVESAGAGTENLLSASKTMEIASAQAVNEEVGGVSEGERKGSDEGEGKGNEVREGEDAGEGSEGAGEAGLPAKVEVGGEADDEDPSVSQWRCDGCDRFAQKRFKDGERLLCRTCFSTQKYATPSELVEDLEGREDMSAAEASISAGMAEKPSARKRRGRPPKELSFGKDMSVGGEGPRGKEGEGWKGGANRESLGGKSAGLARGVARVKKAGRARGHVPWGKRLTDSEDDEDDVGQGVVEVVKKARVRSSAADSAFQPGAMVITGERAHGGVGEAWPGRVVDPGRVPGGLPKKVPASKRAVLLFGREGDVKRFVIVATSTLSKYIPGPENDEIHLADSRGYMAFAIARRCAEVYDSQFVGVVDEGALLAGMDDEAKDTVRRLAEASLEAHLARQRSGFGKRKRRGRSDSGLREVCSGDGSRAGGVVDSTHHERGQRRAAANNRFAPAVTMRQAADSGPGAMRAAVSEAVKKKSDEVGKSLTRSGKRGRRDAKDSDGGASGKKVGGNFENRWEGRTENSAKRLRGDEHLNLIARGPALLNEKESENGRPPRDSDRVPEDKSMGYGKRLVSVLRNAGRGAKTGEVKDVPFPKLPLSLPLRERGPAIAAGVMPQMQAPEEGSPECELDLAKLSALLVAERITNFVTTGYSEEDRKAIAAVIETGCTRFMLNGPALLAARPEDEIVAQEVLATRPGGDRGYRRDGTHYAVVEFVRLARESQKMSLSGAKLVGGRENGI